MCIIVVKKYGVACPSEGVLKTCWDNNSDGAGYMYVRDGLVHIRKGFMTWSKFLAAYQDEHFTADDVFAVHFRIATSGGTNAGRTHPFPMSSDLSVLTAPRLAVDVAMMHNGVFGSGKEDWSDTMLFVKKFANHPIIREHIFSKDKKYRVFVRELVQAKSTGSRLVFMNGNGNIALTGSWEYDKDTDLYYSNNGYKFTKQSFSADSFYYRGYGSGRSWMDDYDSITGVALDELGFFCPNPDCKSNAGEDITWPSSLCRINGGDYTCVDCGRRYTDKELERMCAKLDEKDIKLLSKRNKYLKEEKEAKKHLFELDEKEDSRFGLMYNRNIAAALMSDKNNPCAHCGGDSFTSLMGRNLRVCNDCGSLISWKYNREDGDFTGNHIRRGQVHSKIIKGWKRVLRFYKKSIIAYYDLIQEPMPGIVNEVLGKDSYTAGGAPVSLGETVRIPCSKCGNQLMVRYGNWLLCPDCGHEEKDLGNGYGTYPFRD